uniref:Uncharacterized protein n=1 Tax=Tetranychus urticae TaxID=32264 RepID=T1KA77_TETUR
MAWIHRINGNVLVFMVVTVGSSLLGFYNYNEPMKKLSEDLRGDIEKDKKDYTL